jgi:C-terminal peptidase prc
LGEGSRDGPHKTGPKTTKRVPMKKIIVLIAILLHSAAYAEEDNFLADILRFENVMAKVHQNYVENVSSDSLIEVAIASVLSELDENNRFVTLSNNTAHDSIQLDSSSLLAKKTPNFVVVDGEYFYIKINTINKNTVETIKSALKQSLTNSYSGYIVDIRFSQGGTLPDCVALAEMFVNKGNIICMTKGRATGASKTFKSNRNPILPLDVPLIVLTNKLTASGSEIFAASLQESKRALIVGDSTAGIGNVSSYLPIDKDHLLKLTTSYLLSPAGKNLNKKGGICPDYIVPSEIAEPINIMLFQNGDIQDYADNYPLTDSVNIDGVTKFFKARYSREKIRMRFSENELKFGKVNSLSDYYSVLIKEKLVDIIYDVIQRDIDKNAESIARMMQSLSFLLKLDGRNMDSENIKDETIKKAISLITKK